MRVRELSFDDFRGVAAEWDDLVAADEHPSPFLSHAWIRTWWRHFGRGDRFCGLLVQAGERHVAGVPVAVRRVRSVFGRRTVVEIVGTGRVPTRGMGLADRADAVSRPDAPGARELLLAHLVGLRDAAGADALDLIGIDAAGPTRACLERSGRPLRLLPRSTSPYLPLPERWEDYLATRSRNFRKHLKKHRRQLEDAGPVQVGRLGPGDEIEPWIEEMVSVDAATWKAARGTNLFRHPALHAFFAEVLREMAAAGHVDLHVLRVAETAVAYELCFDFGGRVGSYNSGFRAAWAGSSPGTVLTAAVIESAIGRGRREYDLLRGDEGYKQRWSNAERRELRAILPAPQLRARAWTAAIGLQARLAASPLVRELDDRLSGAVQRLRFAPAPAVRRSRAAAGTTRPAAVDREGDRRSTPSDGNDPRGAPD